MAFDNSIPLPQNSQDETDPLPEFDAPRIYGRCETPRPIFRAFGGTTIGFTVGEYDANRNQIPVGVYLDGEADPYDPEFQEALVEAFQFRAILSQCIDVLGVANYICAHPEEIQSWEREWLHSYIEKANWFHDQGSLFKFPSETLTTIDQAARQAWAAIQYLDHWEAAGANRNPGFVYLLQSPTHAYKIGRTKNPNNRLQTFSVKLPFEVEYICLIKTADMIDLEQRLHAHFSDKRINGEWFALTPEDIEYVKGLAT